MIREWAGWLMVHYQQRVVILGVLVVVAVYAQYAGAQTLNGPVPQTPATWFQQNALAIAVLIFHFGVSWREFLDHRKRITKMEEEVPDTYARKDVVAERMTAIDHEMKMWRESFSFLLRRDDRRGGPVVPS